MTEKQAMVDKLKNTWTTIGGLTLDEKVFIENNIRSCVEVDIYGRTDEAELPLRIGALVRLKADFKLPEIVKGRWFYCNKTQSLNKFLYIENQYLAKHEEGMIEVPPDDLEYVRAQIERHEKGEIDLSKFELRKLVIGNEETWIIPCNGEICTDRIEKYHITSGLLFVRKAEAKKSGGWKELAVYADEKNILRCKNSWNENFEHMTVSEAWLYAIDRGMCPQFAFLDGGGWWNVPTLPSKNEARCVMMRVYVE